MICAVCRREAKGWGWFNPALPLQKRKHYKFCCREHLEKFKDKPMVDPTPKEKAAMEAALLPLGEYVASIDMNRPMASYSRDEILTLIEVVVTAYQAHMMSDEIPF